MVSFFDHFASLSASSFLNDYPDTRAIRPPFGQQVVVSMKKHLIINTTIFCWVIVAEVLVINASSKAQNQPLSLDVVEAVSSVVFVFNYFHVPSPLAILLAVVVVLLPAWLVMVLARRFFGLIR